MNDGLAVYVNCVYPFPWDNIQIHYDLDQDPVLTKDKCINEYYFSLFNCAFLFHLALISIYF